MGRGGVADLVIVGLRGMFLSTIVDRRFAEK